MTEAFIYLVSKPTTQKYEVRGRVGVDAYLEDLNLTKKLGYHLDRLFRVPIEVGAQTINVCTEFVEGKITLDNLDAKVDSLVNE